VSETLAYLAGVIDSDGTIGVKLNSYAAKSGWQVSYSERVHIRQVTREAIDLLAETFGGNVGIEDPHAKRGKPLYRWGVTDKRAVMVLEALLPYLRIKREQAQNCLDLRVVKEASKVQRLAPGRGHVGGAVRSEAITAAMRYHHLRAKELNRVGREEVVCGG
jgi:hypothetical protein